MRIISLLLATTLSLVGCSDDDKESNLSSQNKVKIQIERTKANAKIEEASKSDDPPGTLAQRCGSASQMSGKTVGVNSSEVTLFATPDLQASKLINKKASDVLKSTHYLTIDNTTTVTEQCTQGDWSRIRVKEPDWLHDSHIGWVKSSSLRNRNTDSTGIVEYTEADFVWDKSILPYKKIIVAGVNKVRRENSRCKTVDPGSAYISGSKGTSSNPVFYVTCGTGSNVFNAYFSKSDIDKDHKLIAVKNIDQGRAINLCEKYAKSKAVHPSTFSFSRIMDLAVSEHVNGRTTVASSFTAKNSFNLEIKNNIRCLFDSNGLIEAHISEAQ